MQTGSSGTLIGWKSGQTTFVPLWDRMEAAWLLTQNFLIGAFLLSPSTTDFTLGALGAFEEGNYLTCEKN